MAEPWEDFKSLTKRESEVLLALMDGASAGDICRRSYLSMPTVRSHIQSILRKLGVSSQVAAVARAYRTGWPGTGQHRASA